MFIPSLALKLGFWEEELVGRNEHRRDQSGLLGSSDEAKS